MQIEIPCDHDTGKELDRSKEVANYHPLTQADIEKLLIMALGPDERMISIIQLRLHQGVFGNVCPKRTDGPVADKCRDVNTRFLGFMRGESEAEAGVRACAEALFRIMQP